jgi:uncharacterized membrane protein (TIGR02234 family)
MTSRREYLTVLALGAVGAGLLLLAAGRSWAHGVVAGVPGELEITASGRKVAPVAAGLGLFALAGVVAIVATRRVGRVVVGLLLGLAGVGVLADVIRVAADPNAALHDEAADAAGLTEPVVRDAGVSGWPILAALGAVLVLSAGVWTLLRGRHWPVMSARYERQAAEAATGEPAPAAGAAEGTPMASRGGLESAKAQREMWDAIDRGEDPTG